LVAIEAIAVYYWKPGRQNGNPGLDSDCFSQTPPTVLALKTNKTPKMVLFPVEPVSG
jgi:hypothetical protein